jgi:hypothetical protein
LIIPAKKLLFRAPPRHSGLAERVKRLYFRGARFHEVSKPHRLPGVRLRRR